MRGLMRIRGYLAPQMIAQVQVMFGSEWILSTIRLSSGYHGDECCKLQKYSPVFPHTSWVPRCHVHHHSSHQGEWVFRQHEPVDRQALDHQLWKGSMARGAGFMIK